MNTKELKTNIIKEKSIFEYNEVLDTLFMYFTEQETERIITHFVDNNVALLYRHSDKEIVGVRIEYFKEEFLPVIARGNEEWKLSNTGEKLDGNMDIGFRAIEIHKVATRPFDSNQFTIPNAKKKLKFEKVYA